MAGTGPAAAYTSSLRSFKCSRCDASFTDMTRCKQHCNQPGSFCNRGRAREDFARVISVEVLFRASDRDVGGTRARQDAGDLDHDGHPYNDSDGGPAAPQRRRIYPPFQVSQVDIFNDILLDIRSRITYLYISKPV